MVPSLLESSIEKTRATNDSGVAAASACSTACARSTSHKHSTTRYVCKCGVSGTVAAFDCVVCCNIRVTTVLDAVEGYSTTFKRYTIIGGIAMPQR